MPIFEYICQDCGQKYDKFVRSGAAKVELRCPVCGSSYGEKTFSAFSARSTAPSSLGRASNSGPACGPVG